MKNDTMPDEIYVINGPEPTRYEGSSLIMFGLKNGGVKYHHDTRHQDALQIIGQQELELKELRDLRTKQTLAIATRNSTLNMAREALRDLLWVFDSTQNCREPVIIDGKQALTKLNEAIGGGDE